MVRPTLIVIPSMLIMGTCYSITQKVLLQQTSTGYNDVQHKFDKPFTQTLLMITAMMLVLIVHKYWDTTGKGPHPPTPWKTRFILAIPSSCDMITTTLNIFGLIYINVSIYQMLRSAYIIFTSILSIIFLKRHIHGYEWFGISMVVAALILVGYAGIYIPPIDGSSTPEEDHPVSQKILGALLVIAAQVFHASQVVLEEYLLNVKFQGTLGALEVTGNEGIMGFFILILIGFPFAFLCPGNDPSPMTKGSLENIWDTMLMVYHNPVLVGIFVIYIIFAGTYNVSAMLVLAFTSSMNEAITDAVRTLLVWVCMLISGAIGLPFGEPWNRYSWMELGGFILLVTGNFIYNGHLKIPFFKYTGQNSSQFHNPGETKEEDATVNISLIQDPKDYT
ncbi:Integral membrane protein [Tritrichomonas foetus]|uniref:Integral membrane protein n=1 Tax=Tritrichomonas foetus TaxID=1144522 RepID=A0A1J4J662_9EUKA|nr:Integral membrane protein [Tritrichomonas foetus]|eukprot:OHS92941.1 Integral membrane protein [Tritrichomonas foetus]